MPKSRRWNYKHEHSVIFAKLPPMDSSRYEVARSNLGNMSSLLRKASRIFVNSFAMSSGLDLEECRWAPTGSIGPMGPWAHGPPGPFGPYGPHGPMGPMDQDSQDGLGAGWMGGRIAP